MKKSIIGTALLCVFNILVHGQTMFMNTPAVPAVPPSPTVIKIAGVPAIAQVPASSFQDAQDDEPMVSKSFSRTFAVNASDKVSFSNKYGTMMIKIWDRKEVKVDVDIKAYSTNSSDAQRLLDGVSIESGKSGDLISVKTEMEQIRGNYGSNTRNGKVIWRREVKINYIVYMPGSMALTAATSYGNLTVDNFSGPTSLKVQYGNLTAGDLRNSNNYISVQYGNTNIQNINGADINVQYGGGVNINTVNNIDLNAQYIPIKITSVTGTANVKQQYNKLTIGTVNKLTLKSQYAGVTIGTLKGDASVNMTYQTLNIDNVQTAARNISLDGNYVNFNLGFAANYAADLNVNTRYGSFKYRENVHVREAGEDDDRRGYSSSKSYSGKIGRGGSGTVNINTSYGSVSIK